MKEIFVEEGVPGQLVWIAEVESAMNPKARSRAGALGMFQFMPDTARRFGLRTAYPDERLNPEKSARAAAKYLRSLHEQFGSWPLAIAAYNAGEGCVERIVARHGSYSFDRIAGFLPGQTRSYVPRVMAIVAVREGVTPHVLPPPSTTSEG
jgi:membrane-bound lytic murein transglycosylase D